MSVTGDRRSREQKTKQEGKKELAIVSIKKEDVELIMTEMEISPAAAEGGLRGTHEQRGRGAYCSNQLMRAFSDIPTGLIYGNKIFLSLKKK